MSANSFSGVPSFLDGLSEADKFIRIVECVRELKMHSILVPELREISELGLCLQVQQLISNQRDFESQLLAKTAKKDHRQAKVWGPDNEWADSDPGIPGLYLTSSDDCAADGDGQHESTTVGGEARPPNNTPVEEEDGAAEASTLSSDRVAEAGSEDNTEDWSSENSEIMVRIDDGDGGHVYVAVEKHCFCSERFGNNTDWNQVFHYDPRCPVRYHEGHV